MARHRSPQGRRAHLGPPLSAVMAAAGVGAARSIPVPQPTSLPARFVAAVVAGGALAAAGQQALTEAVPLATDGGTNLLKLVASELVGGSSAALSDVPADVRAEVPLAVVAPLVAESPVDAVAAEPVVADAASLVKAADLQRAAAEAATRAAQEATQKAAAAEAAAAEAARKRRQPAMRRPPPRPPRASSRPSPVRCRWSRAASRPGSAPAGARPTRASTSPPRSAPRSACRWPAP